MKSRKITTTEFIDKYGKVTIESYVGRRIIMKTSKGNEFKLSLIESTKYKLLSLLKFFIVRRIENIMLRKERRRKN